MIIKRIFTAFALSFLMMLSANAGDPPTVMFLPDKTWCNANNCVTRSERNGKTRVTENYDEAFLNSDLKNVVTALNDLLTQYGLKPKAYTEASEIDDDEEAEEELFEGAESGSELDATPYEMALNKLKPDIIVKIGWDDNKVGFNRTVSYRLEAIDSYSGKSIAASTAETPSVKTTIPLGAVLKNAATENMSGFFGKLRDHFDDVQTNGREITLTLRIIGNGSGINFNSEYGGKELNEVIHDWMHDNTVNHAFSQRNATRNRLQYEQIRIPLKDSKGAPYDAHAFVKQLQKHLQSAYGIRAENTTKGLGSGRLYIGEK